MPRGFLVKRTKNAAAFSYRVRNSDDSDSDHEHIQTNFGSPDSGYSPSPISLTPRERDLHAFDRDPTQGTTLPSSPLPSYPSPHYFYAFDRLSVSNCSPVNLTPVKNETGTAALSSPNKRRGPAEAEKKVKTPKKPKACRKINFDEDKTSPVSGTIIKDISDTDEEGQVVCGDIDSAFNYVEITAEAKAELEKIENKIGDYVCQLCKEYFDDAFQLARHRCSRIVHVEYRCPECDKVFNCPANLASHRRWHKPKTASDKKNVPTHILPANIPSVALNSNHSNGTNGDPMDESSDKCDSPRMLTSPPGSPNNYTASTHHHQYFNSNSSPSPSSASPPAVTINDCPSSTVEEGQFQSLCDILLGELGYAVGFGEHPVTGCA
ncbi:insulinoma-associated protein 1a-like [Octopus vulgaris]|uniref:Insulinoma-associated protein 1a-like n=1 Tax=Octopus vulgaris TaxID=6645 RepID=A0AA36B8Z4_OCTVU|nr:insulinoma-associated protein 1a-like [Octopus vulgaris]